MVCTGDRGLLEGLHRAANPSCSHRVQPPASHLMWVTGEFSLVQGVPSFCLKAWLVHKSVFPYGDRAVSYGGGEDCRYRGEKWESPEQSLCSCLFSNEGRNSLVKLLYLTNGVRKLFSGCLKLLERFRTDVTPVSSVQSCLSVLV